MDTKHTHTIYPLYRLFRLVYPLWRWIALSVLLGFLTVGSSIALMGTSSWLIAKAALQPSIAELNVAIVGVRFFGISKGVFRYLERYVSHQVTLRLLKELRVWFYTALEPLAPARLMSYHSSDLLTRIVSDIETLDNFYIRGIAPPIVAFLSGITILIFAAILSPTLGVILLASLVLTGVGLPAMMYRLSQHYGQMLIQDRADLNLAIQDGIQGMGELLAFGAATRQADLIQHKSTQLRAKQERLSLLEAFVTAAWTLLMSLTTFILLVIAIPRIDPLYLAPLVLAVTAAFEAFLPLSLAAHYLSSSQAAAQRLFEIIDAEPAVIDSAQTLPAPKHFDLCFRDVSFQYPDTTQWALQNISFDLPQGKKIAIVGASGAGKSTLLNLLLRFWEVQKGEILLDHYPLNRYRQLDLRSIMGVVTQRTYLFNTSIRENLRLANPAAQQTDIETAAQQAGIHEFILSLPNGYDTWVGEQGLKLSGGERQRIALARLLLKNAPIVILDEAFAHLDTINTQHILANIQTLFQDRSLIFITHQPEGLDKMDEILVLS